MEFAIPVSNFDPSNVKWGQPRLGPFRKTIPFSYEEGGIMFNNLVLALQPLKVIEIDNERNQLVLEETRKPSLLSRLEQFQTVVTYELEHNSKRLIEDKKAPPLIKSPLQLWLKSNKLTLYLSEKPEQLNFYTHEGQAVFSDKVVKPGDMIRAVVKIQGLSLQMSEDDNWTGKSRIQHHILQLYKVNS